MFFCVVVGLRAGEKNRLTCERVFVFVLVYVYTIISIGAGEKSRIYEFLTYFFVFCWCTGDKPYDFSNVFLCFCWCAEEMRRLTL